MSLGIWTSKIRCWLFSAIECAQLLALTRALGKFSFNILLQIWMARLGCGKRGTFLLPQQDEPSRNYAHLLWKMGSSSWRSASKVKQLNVGYRNEDGTVCLVLYTPGLLNTISSLIPRNTARLFGGVCGEWGDGSLVILWFLSSSACSCRLRLGSPRAA